MMHNTIQSVRDARRVDITNDMHDPWVKDIDDNVIARESVIYLVCDGDIVFMIHRHDFASIEAYLTDGVKSFILLAMDGNFSIYIESSNDKGIESDANEFSELLGQGIVNDAFRNAMHDDA